MLYWTIQFTFISMLLIFLIHYLINFFKATLTVPKIKDLVKTPLQKYDSMYSIISNSSSNNNTIDNQRDYKQDPVLMKNELKNFLKTQLTNSTSTDISTLNPTSTQTYSLYN
jgi:hypothetical protein